MALFLGLAAAATLYAFRVYRRMEVRVPASGLLASLRAGALVLILLLLFDPRVPGSGASRDSARWVLLDASLSMTAAGGGAWREATTEAARLRGAGWRVMTFGGVPRPDTMLSHATAGATLLAPALRAVAEVGASDIVVVTDLRITDAVDVRAILARLPVRVSFRAVGGPVANAGVTGFRLDGPARTGRPVRVHVEVRAQDTRDSVTVEIREEDRLVGVRTVASPPRGLVRAVEMELPAPAAAGWVRYDARAKLPGDGFQPDDERVTYAAVDRAEGAVVLVSLDPGWEARALLPVLEQVTGLRGIGYVRVRGGRYLPIGRAEGRGGPEGAERVRAAAQSAALLVIEGSRGAPGWLLDAVSGAPGVLILATDPASAALGGVRTGTPRPGEWYVTPDVPPSPLAGELAGTNLAGLPPLSGLLPVSGTVRVQAPLRAQHAGSGPARPVLVLTTGAGRRRATALARGFWRWAVRAGADRNAYRRMWSGAAGWLLAEEAGRPSPDFRPLRRVWRRDEPIAWLPGPDSAAVTLTLARSDTVVLDTTVANGGARAPLTRALEPGTYTYRAADPAGRVLGEGRFDVSAYTDEMLPRRLEPATGRRDEARRGGGGGAPRPLRTLPWPYLFILVLLCGEWVGRRRSGLR